MHPAPEVGQRDRTGTRDDDFYDGQYSPPLFSMFQAFEFLSFKGSNTKGVSFHYRLSFFNN